MKSWIEVTPESDFPIENIPFGVCRDKISGKVRCATRIGNYVIDLNELADLGYLNGLGIGDMRVFKNSYLNDFISYGRPVWRAVRKRLQEVFDIENKELQNNNHKKEI